MARSKREYDDDDGRTIADMSGISRQNLFLPRLPQDRRAKTQPVPEPENDRPWEEHGLSPEEQRWYILGALKASMLIAAAFLAGLGVVILIILLIGK